MIKETLIRVITWVRTFIHKHFNSTNEDLPYYLTILIAAVLFIIALNGFVQLTDELAENDLVGVDEAVTEAIVSYRGDGLTDFLTFATHLGDRNAYAAITAMLALFFFLKKRSWKFILQTTVVLALASLSSIVLKRVFNRERPSLEQLVEVNTLSYPSGHSMSAMAFYGFLIFLCVRHGMPRWLRFVLVTILILLIISIGISRIYLGVHYPTDVAGGFIGGLIWVTFCAVVFSIFELLRKRQRARRTHPKTQ